MSAKIGGAAKKILLVSIKAEHSNIHFVIKTKCMRQLLILLFSLLSLSAFAQKDSNTYVQLNNHVYPTINSKSASEKILVYQVLRLTNQNREKSLLVVFCETSITNSKQRAKMRSDYMLKRERIYLSNVFFSKVEVLEKEIFSSDIKTCLQLLELKYTQLRLWSILQSDFLFRK